MSEGPKKVDHRPLLHITSCFSWQETFISYKESTLTKTEKNTCDVEAGWYSKDGMAKILKWSTTLVYRQVLLGEHETLNELYVSLSLTIHYNIFITWWVLGIHFLAMCSSKIIVLIIPSIYTCRFLFHWWLIKEENWRCHQVLHGRPNTGQVGHPQKWNYDSNLAKSKLSYTFFFPTFNCISCLAATAIPKHILITHHAHISKKTVHPGRSCKYGGDDEYWVETRETGLQQQERTRSEKSTEISKDRFCFV